MPAYQDKNGTTFRRKNLYMPCILGPVFNAASPEEQTRLFKATYWADNITGREWEFILGQLEEASYRPVVKSRLKKKMVGWWMALARICVIDPDLYNQSVSDAKALYREQVQEPCPVFASEQD